MPLRLSSDRWRWPLAAAAALAACAALAHGDWKPRHGGSMNDGGETSFELVYRHGGIVAHVSDHGVPVDTRGSSPELLLHGRSGTKVLKGTAHGSRVVFDRVSLAAVDSLDLRLTFANGSVAYGRFPGLPVAGKR